jgi:hypothetical protein
MVEPFSVQLEQTTDGLKWYAYYLSDNIAFYKMRPDLDEGRLRAIAEKKKVGEFVFDEPREVDCEFLFYKKYYVGRAA